jgi:release factor glutamine methyltransferase
MAHVLVVNRASILAWPDRLLTPKQLTRYRNLVARRADREPLAYILGHREFYGLDFGVDPRVLIPRPETELLVDHALRFARSSTGPLQIADVGAGSGAIAVTLAVHLQPAPGSLPMGNSPVARDLLPDRGLAPAVVYALDDSGGALAVTAENAHRHGVARRVRCLQGDLLAPLPGPVDLITANLPYVTTLEWEGLQPEILGYEPRSALDGGPDGLRLIGRLLAMVPLYLRPGGEVLLEIGAEQGGAVVDLARRHMPQSAIQLHQDYAGLDRVASITMHQ